MKNFKVEIQNLDTNKIKVLKRKEMEELFLKYQNGDLKAKEELINGNLKLVLSILKKYNNGKHNVDDLFQVGVVGLIKNLLFSINILVITPSLFNYGRDKKIYKR